MYLPGWTGKELYNFLFKNMKDNCEYARDLFSISARGHNLRFYLSNGDQFDSLVLGVDDRGLNKVFICYTGPNGLCIYSEVSEDGFADAAKRDQEVGERIWQEVQLIDNQGKFVCRLFVKKDEDEE